MIPRTGLGPRAGTYGVVGTWNVRWTQVPKSNAYAISHGALPLSVDRVDVLAAWHTIDELDVCHVITENAHVQFEDGYVARWSMNGTCRVDLEGEKLRVHVTYQTARLTTMRGTPSAGLVAYTDKTLSMQTRKSSWSIVGLTSSYRIDQFSAYDKIIHLALLTRM